MTLTSDTDLDRPARIRRALCSVVAERGFHGASMQAIAKEAGVAAGTAYVHYSSKDEVVVATYLEAKHDLWEAAVADVDPSLKPAERFHELWMNVYSHLTARPDVALFLLQVEASPYAAMTHEAAPSLDSAEDLHPASGVLADVLDRFVDLPPMIQFELAMGPAIRLAASQDKLGDAEVDRLIDSCWRSVFRG